MNKIYNNICIIVINGNESQLSVIWGTTKTKRYQQEFPTYLKFSGRYKLYIFLG